mmetsp:Transcript_50194/g.104743  ORF Transcript_50194/g.104743 Transcript_50194/m.104743 type:complete len:187 (-) Transcript_50194:470-1030(-)
MQVDWLYSESLAKSASTLTQLETSLFNLERFQTQNGLKPLDMQENSRFSSTDHSDDEFSDFEGKSPGAAGQLSLFNIRNTTMNRVDQGVNDIVNTATAVQEGMFEAAHHLVGMAGLTSLQSGIPVAYRKKVDTSDAKVDEAKHYEHVLARLAYEGYDNEDLNRELLAKYAGNYDDVVAELSKAGLL